MIRSSVVFAVSAAVAMSIVSVASAAPHSHRFAIFNNKGKVLFDDGKLDGKGCVVGKRAVFDKKTGGLKVVSAVKCNF